MFVFILKQYPENFAFSILRILQLFAREVCIFLKGILKQIGKPINIFVFIWKQFVEDFTLKDLLRFEICACEIYEKFVDQYSETIEYVKN